MCIYVLKYGVSDGVHQLPEIPNLSLGLEVQFLPSDDNPQVSAEFKKVTNRQGLESAMTS